MEQQPTSDTSCPPATPERWTDKFERQARLHPARTAVISGSSTLSYGALSDRSNQIANLLRSNGIGRGKFVGLGLHRSLDLPAALLGILKSGAAYVPLDPGSPATRIEQMIGSAKLEYVITNSALAPCFPGVQTICMDDAAVHDASTDHPEPTAGQDDLIYAIFTSGSNGLPKAETVHHRGFENLLRWYSIELTLGPADRTLVITSPSFDLTQKNFFVPLITGGTLILDDCETYDISRISKLICEQGVTLINCTPSAFYPLVDADAGNGYSTLSSLRFAVLGGEPISVPRLRAWLEHPNCRAEVVNSYGPTEGTKNCAFQRLHRGNLDDYAFVPSGREFPDVQAALPDDVIPLFADGIDRTGSPMIGTPSEMESDILALWSEILGRPINDATASFFALGGNSIHIAIVHVRLMEMTGRKFSINELFAHSSARSIAEFLSPRSLGSVTPFSTKRVRPPHAGFSRFRRTASR
jgi:non-ribosomal peptide synthetase component F